MKTVPLTLGYEAIVDDDDYASVAAHRWHAVEIGGTVYAGRKGATRVYLHRDIMGISDRKILVDHKNMNGLDCRRSNLRVATKSQNMANRGPARNNKSGLKGVFFDKARGKWQASIGVQCRVYHLGRYHTKELAAAAYDAAAVRFFGEFARTNAARGA